MMEEAPPDLAARVRESPTEELRSSLFALEGRSSTTSRLLRTYKNVVLFGPPGTGKTHAALAVRDHWRAEHGPTSTLLTTFHPSYSYEDFVEGYRPNEDDPGKFSLQGGILLKAVEQAKQQPTLLVIDEINRADVARVFGELITYLEATKRDIEFTTAQRPRAVRFIPQDLYVLGTMNTADKSISLLDVALRRRFKFLGFPPDPDFFVRSGSWKDSVAGVPLSAVLRGINERLLTEGVERDRRIGHALLAIGKNEEDEMLADRLVYDVVPLVEEYLFNDPEAVARVLPGLVDSAGVMAPFPAASGVLSALSAPSAPQPPNERQSESGTDDDDDVLDVGNEAD